MIETQYHEYRSEYEFGSSNLADRRDEYFGQDRNTRQFNESIGSNEVEINDIGGHFINEYALDEGRNNKL